MNNSWRRIAEILIILIAIVLSSIGTTMAQSRVRILGLSIVGNETTDAGLIRAHSGLSVGQEVTGDDIQTAIHQLWKLGLFSDVAIVEEKEAADGVYLLVRVEEYPRLDRIEVKGNRKLKGDDLNELLHLTRGQVVQPRDLVLLRNRLKGKYSEMGYLLAEVTVETFRSGDTGRLIVEVRVHEGRKVKIRRVDFVGNDAFN
ncbi:MAG: POTRA domain-containing protein, partial [Calditrichota bacterium]